MAARRHYLNDSGSPGMPSMGVFNSWAAISTLPALPSGQAFLVDDEGNYLIDDDGDYLTGDE